MIEKKILRVICVELHHYCGLPTAEAIPIGELELEHVWVLHGGLFYYTVRKYIYGARVNDDFAEVVRRAVSAMLDGTRLHAAGADPSGPMRRRRRSRLGHQAAYAATAPIAALRTSAYGSGPVWFATPSP